MAEWIDPIYDRTQEDVEFAIRTISEWIKTKSHNVYDLKGCFNVSDINRIENNILYLSEKLNEWGFSVSVFTRQWSMSDMPTRTDIERIIRNIRNILNAFYVSSDAPLLPSNILTYNDANHIEENLYLVKYLLDRMVDTFKKSNTFKSGSKMFLPIRR